MKKNFLTGLALLLPTLITFLILKFIINFLTKPFQSGMEHLLVHFGFSPAHPNLLLISSQLLVLLFLVGALILLGFLARYFIAATFIALFDYILATLPGVNKIYKGMKEVTHSLFNAPTPSFSKAVYVPFPSPSTFALGFITQETDPEHVSVYIPGTPNILFGYMMTYNKSQIIESGLSVDKALKFVVSCGVIYDTLPKSENIAAENRAPYSNGGIVIPEGKTNTNPRSQ